MRRVIAMPNHRSEKRIPRSRLVSSTPEETRTTIPVRGESERWTPLIKKSSAF